VTSGAALLRLLLGLVLGFAGAYVTLQAIDRFSPAAPVDPLEVVLGPPSFDSYCARDEGRQLRGVATTGDANGWQCVGRIQGLWTTEPIVVDEVCRWEHGSAATGRLFDPIDPAGWMCVTAP
jgi:hypothetical protein